MQITWMLLAPCCTDWPSCNRS